MESTDYYINLIKEAATGAWVYGNMIHDHEYAYYDMIKYLPGIWSPLGDALNIEPILSVREMIVALDSVSPVDRIKLAIRYWDISKALEAKVYDLTRNEYATFITNPQNIKELQKASDKKWNSVPVNEKPDYNLESDVVLVVKKAKTHLYKLLIKMLYAYAKDIFKAVSINGTSEPISAHRIFQFGPRLATKSNIYPYLTGPIAYMPKPYDPNDKDNYTLNFPVLSSKRSPYVNNYPLNSKPLDTTSNSLFGPLPKLKPNLVVRRYGLNNNTNTNTNNKVYVRAGPYDASEYNYPKINNRKLFETQNSSSSDSDDEIGTSSSKRLPHRVGFPLSYYSKSKSQNKIPTTSNSNLINDFDNNDTNIIKMNSILTYLRYLIDELNKVLDYIIHVPNPAIDKLPKINKLLDDSASFLLTNQNLETGNSDAIKKLNNEINKNYTELTNLLDLIMLVLNEYSRFENPNGALYDPIYNTISNKYKHYQTNEDMAEAFELLKKKIMNNNNNSFNNESNQNNNFQSMNNPLYNYYYNNNDGNNKPLIQSNPIVNSSRSPGQMSLNQIQEQQRNNKNNQLNNNNISMNPFAPNNNKTADEMIDDNLNKLRKSVEQGLLVPTNSSKSNSNISNDDDALFDYDPTIEPKNVKSQELKAGHLTETEYHIGDGSDMKYNGKLISSNDITGLLLSVKKLYMRLAYAQLIQTLATLAERKGYENVKIRHDQVKTVIEQIKLLSSESFKLLKQENNLIDKLCYKIINKIDSSITEKDIKESLVIDIGKYPYYSYTTINNNESIVPSIM